MRIAIFVCANLDVYCVMESQFENEGVSTGWGSGISMFDIYSRYAAINDVFMSEWYTNWYTNRYFNFYVSLKPSIYKGLTLY